MKQDLKGGYYSIFNMVLMVTVIVYIIDNIEHDLLHTDD